MGIDWRRGKDASAALFFPRYSLSARLRHYRLPGRWAKGIRPVFRPSGDDSTRRLARSAIASSATQRSSLRVVGSATFSVENKERRLIDGADHGD